MLTLLVEQWVLDFACHHSYKLKASCFCNHHEINVLFYKNILMLEYNWFEEIIEYKCFLQSIIKLLNVWNIFFLANTLKLADIYIYIYISGPILENKDMHAIFQKKGNKRAKKDKIFELLHKNVQSLKIF